MNPAAGPFSRPNRVALIDRYFGDRAVVPREAWKDVYRLLFWCDPTTGLAHCYESDKSQPGRPWYARTLAFHDWLGEQLDLSNDALPDALDWMFRQVIEQVAAEEAGHREALTAKAESQRSRYDLAMPTPGDDPELRMLIEPLLPSDPSEWPKEDVIRDTLRKIRTHITSENKRKNLLGRGFEDVLAGILRRLDGEPPTALGTQVAINEIPGFGEPRSGDKAEKVDLWVGPSPSRGCSYPQSGRCGQIARSRCAVISLPTWRQTGCVIHLSSSGSPTSSTQHVWWRTPPIPNPIATSSMSSYTSARRPCPSFTGWIAGRYRARLPVSKSSSSRAASSVSQAGSKD